MKKKAIVFSYFKRTLLVWILFFVCVYSVIACEFEAWRIELLKIDKDIAYINKVNGIIKNLSFSYIAGVIFFFLSDTIPFLRRKRIACRNVEKSLTLMVNAIDDFSVLVNNKKWDKKSDVSKIYEDITGCEYTDDMPPIKFHIPFCTQLNAVVGKLNTCIDFVISQELYVSAKLINDIESIKNSKNNLFVYALSTDDYVDPENIVNVTAYLIEIKSTISKYL